MTTTIKKVALAGASGALGAAVLKALVGAGFEVSALVRTPGKIPSLPAGVKEVVVDYTAQQALVTVLKGQDAVVSTLAINTAAAHIALANASIDVGTVKRFIPSNFGSDLNNPELRQLPVFGEKIQVEDFLVQKAKETALTYTFVANAAWLDWGLEYKLVLDPVDGKATLWDGGEHLFSVTRLSAVGQSVVGVLQHPEETKNRTVYVQETAVSMKQLVKIVQELNPAKTWTVVEGSTLDTKTKSDEALSKGVVDVWVLMGYIYRACFSKGTGAHFQRNDNALLGVKELSDSELKEAVKETLAKIPGAL